MNSAEAFVLGALFATATVDIFLHVAAIRFQGKSRHPWPLGGIVSAVKSIRIVTNLAKRISEIESAVANADELGKSNRTLDLLGRVLWLCDMRNSPFTKTKEKKSGN